MNIYYSRSNEVDDARMGVHLQTLTDNLPFQYGKDITLLRHERGTDYNPELLASADLVVVCLQDDSDPNCTIGKGCYDEIHTALSKNIVVMALLYDNDTGEVFMQQMTDSDTNTLDEDDWACYGTVGLWEYLSDCLEHNTPGARIDNDAAVSQALYDSLGEAKFRELFETHTAVDRESLTRPLNQFDEVRVLSNAKGYLDQYADIGHIGEVSNPCDSSGDVVVHMPARGDSAFHVAFFKRHELQLVSTADCKPPEYEVVSETKSGKTYVPQGSSDDSDELLLLG